MSIICASLYTDVKYLDKIYDRIREITDKLSKNEYNPPLGFLQLQNVKIKEALCSPIYLAFLTQDGYICRLKYDIILEKVDTKPDTFKKAFKDLPSNSTKTSNTSARTAGLSYSSILTQNSTSAKGSKIRRNLPTTFRNRNILIPHRTLIPASSVPEDFISQAQAVLQGKSRAVIVRELQRTNLDINMAVNNLLSREEDEENGDDDDYEDTIDTATYFPLSGTGGSGEDLITLLDTVGVSMGSSSNGAPTNAPTSMRGARTLFDSSLFNDTIFEHLGTTTVGGSTGTTTTGTTSARTTSGRSSWLYYSQLPPPPIPDRDDRRSIPLSTITKERNKFTDAPDSKMANEEATKGTTKVTGPNPSSHNTNYAISVSPNLEYWMDKEGALIKFSHMAATDSELLGVTLYGVLHQWLWSSKQPYLSNLGDIHHPRTRELGLLNEQITQISGTKLRASVLTATNKVATWIDPSFAMVGGKFEHAAVEFGDFRNDPIQALDVCDYYTMIKTGSGKLYWWGFMPPKMRNKLCEKNFVQAVSRGHLGYKRARTELEEDEEIKVGTLVTFKTRPMLCKGALVLGFENALSRRPTLAILQQNVTCNYDSIVNNGSAVQGKNQKEECNGPQKLVKVKIVSPLEYVSMTSKKCHGKEHLRKDTTGTAGREEAKVGMECDAPYYLNDDQSDPFPNQQPKGKAHTADQPQPSTDNGNLAFPPPPMDQHVKSSSASASERIKLWNVDEMIVLEDSHEQVIGKVIKVDEAYAIVQNVGNKVVDSEDLPSILRNCKVLKKDDLIPISSQTTNSQWKRSDCFIKTPRRFNLPDHLQLVTYSIDPLRFQGIAKNVINDKYCYVKGHFGCSNKLDTEQELPFEYKAFIGDSADNIKLYTTKSDNSDVLLLRDGNRTLCPYLFDGTREPDPLDSFPIHDLHVCFVPTPITPPHADEDNTTGDNNGPRGGREIMISLLCFDPLPLTQALLKCNFERFTTLITTGLDASSLMEPSAYDPNSIGPQATKSDIGALVKKIFARAATFQAKPLAHQALLERLDCNSNILHTLVDLAAPFNAKEEDSDGNTSGISNRLSHSLERLTRMGDAMDSLLDAMSVTSGTTQSNTLISRKNIRDLMRKATNLARQLRETPPRIGAYDSATTAVTTSATNTSSLPSSNEPSNVNDNSTTPTCLPPSNSPNSVDNTLPTTNVASIDIGNDVQMDVDIPIETWPPEEDQAFNNALKEISESNLASKNEDSILVNRTDFTLTSYEREAEALRILSYICDKCDCMLPYLYDLLREKDLLGCTPFMRAIKNRAYSAAITIFNCAKKVAKLTIAHSTDLEGGLESGDDHLLEMVFPPDSDPDKSPLYMLCRNDTCSFTWTGKQHINQDIFECKTCGLTGSLCCCTECAQVCHRGHVVKFKRSSPTAYCDCWEKCKCKALIPGSQYHRYDMLTKLLLDVSQLVRLPNSRGENILLFLAQTVGRQVVEQRQYRPSLASSSKNASRSSATALQQASSLYDDDYYYPQSAGQSALAPSDNSTTKMPVHDLEPPRFSRKALERLLSDWEAVRAVITSGTDDISLIRDFNEGSSPNNVKLDESATHYLGTQVGSSRLDKFVHCLVVKCNIEMLEALLTTLIREMQNESVPNRRKEATHVARRFIRSVIRIFVVLNMELAPGKAKKRVFSALGYSLPLTKCKRAFLSLINVSLEELAKTADCLICPVRMGITKPTMPFTLVTSNVEAVQGCDELFNTDPLSSMFSHPDVLPADPPADEAAERVERRRAVSGGRPRGWAQGRKNRSTTHAPTTSATSESSPAATLTNWAAPPMITGHRNEPSSLFNDGQDDALRTISRNYNDEGLASRINAASQTGTHYDRSSVYRQLMGNTDREEDTDRASTVPLSDLGLLRDDDDEEEEDDDELANRVGEGNNDDGEEEEEERGAEDEDYLDYDDDDDEVDDGEDLGDTGSYEEVAENGSAVIDTGALTDEDAYYFYFDEELARNGSDNQASSTAAQQRFEDNLIASAIVNNIHQSIDVTASTTTTDDPNSDNQNEPVSGNRTRPATNNFREYLMDQVEPSAATTTGEITTTSYQTSPLTSRRSQANLAPSAATTILSGNGTDDVVPHSHLQHRFNESAIGTHRRYFEHQPVPGLRSTRLNSHIDSALALLTQPGFSSSQVQRILQTPSTMQWAVRRFQGPSSRHTAPNASVTSNGMVYMDSTNARRNNSLGHHHNTNQAASTMSNTIQNLSRAYGIITRQIGELLFALEDYSEKAPGLPRILAFTKKERRDIKKFVDDCLGPTWQWIFRVMDSLEWQLQFGTALNTASAYSNAAPHGILDHLAPSDAPNSPLPPPPPPNHGERRGVGSRINRVPLRNIFADNEPNLQDPRGQPFVSSRNNQLAASVAANELARLDFLTYALSLMRSHGNEHLDYLPNLDISSYKHIAYVFDALIHFLRTPVWLPNASKRQGRNKSAGDNSLVGLSNFWPETDYSVHRDGGAGTSPHKEQQVVEYDEDDDAGKVAVSGGKRKATRRRQKRRRQREKKKRNKNPNAVVVDDDDEANDAALVARFSDEEEEVVTGDGEQNDGARGGVVSYHYYYDVDADGRPNEMLAEEEDDDEDCEDRDGEEEYAGDDYEVGPEPSQGYYRRREDGGDSCSDDDDDYSEEDATSTEDDSFICEDDSTHDSEQDEEEEEGERLKNRVQVDENNISGTTDSCDTQSTDTSSDERDENNQAGPSISRTVESVPTSFPAKKRRKKIGLPPSKRKPITVKRIKTEGEGERPKGDDDKGRKRKGENLNKDNYTDQAPANDQAGPSIKAEVGHTPDPEITGDTSMLEKVKSQPGPAKVGKKRQQHTPKSERQSTKNNSKPKGRKLKASCDVVPRVNPFFKRSDSTLFLGYPAPDPFTTSLCEALPLADQPHLLKPNARREDMFKISRAQMLNVHNVFEKIDGGSAGLAGGRKFKACDASKHGRDGCFDHRPSNRMGLSSSPFTERRVPCDRGPTGMQDTNQNSTKSKEAAYLGTSVTPDSLLRRWNMSLDLFSRMFIDDVGAEPGSILVELGGFPVKEIKFRAEMEKLRNSQSKDLTFEVERERHLLLQQTIKQLNNFYSRRSNSSGPPLAVQKVKVTFKDEPGEGSGVARSFYSALAMAFASTENLPNLDGCLPGTLKTLQFNLWNRIKSRERMRGTEAHQFIRNAEGVTPTSTSVLPTHFFKTTLSTSALPFYPKAYRHEDGTSSTPPNNDHLTPNQKMLGERLYPKINALKPNHARQITGMILELAPAVILFMLASEESLQVRVNEAFNLLQTNHQGVSNADNNQALPSLKTIPHAGGNNSDSQNNFAEGGARRNNGQSNFLAQLFHQPGKMGFYSPMPVKNSPERWSAFRNVGRIMGLCLLQNEVFNMQFNRHVLKYIMGKPLGWHDFAFYDPVMYESLRSLLQSAAQLGPQAADDCFKQIDLDFTVEVSEDLEKGGSEIINKELVPGGKDMTVTALNVQQYIEAYARYKMESSMDKALENMKLGIFDVLPKNAFDGLTPEDLRLLLNGIGEISVHTLMSYTSFNDECNATAEKIAQFKKWFWFIVDKMTQSEKQDLLYFWMSSSTLPASKDGFQPTPSVTIRPADDQHLPTANTCISRLYIPLYSNKTIFKNKLLMAIKTKTFGFV